MIKNYKKLIIFAVVGLLILSGLYFGISTLWDYFITQKVITLNPTTGTTITLGTQYKDTQTINNEILRTTSKISKRLHPGNYVVKFSAKDYESENQIINLNKDSIIPTPKLNYTTDKLSRVLINERKDIHTVVLTVTGKNYTITDESLLKQANWYSAMLVPTDSNQDTMKIILKKESSKWVVAVKPTVVIFIGDYPNIPQDVIRATNKLRQPSSEIYQLLR
jgi:hypothetical protein